MDILKKLSKYFIITLAIMFVCSFVVLVDKFHKIEYNVFDILETYKALKYFFILGVTAFTASVAYSIGIAALFSFNKLKVQTWKEFVRKLAAGLLLVIPLCYGLLLRLVRLSPNEEGVCLLETGNDGQCSKRY